MGEARVSTFFDPAHLRQVEALEQSTQLGIAEQLQVPLTTEFPNYLFFIKIIYNQDQLKKIYIFLFKINKILMYKSLNRINKFRL